MVSRKKWGHSMRHISIRLGTTLNQPHDRNWRKRHITEIHSSYVFEELLANYLSRFIEQDEVRFTSDELVGIELLVAHETKSYMHHTFDGTDNQVLVHEFTSKTFNYENYLMILDEKEKFRHFAELVREVLVPLLEVHTFSKREAISDIIKQCLRQIEMNDYKLVILLNKTPKSNKKRNRIAVFKLIVSVTGASFWIEVYEKGLRLFQAKVIEEIANPNSFSLYFGTSSWESDDVFTIHSKVRNWNARVDVLKGTIDIYKQIRD